MACVWASLTRADAFTEMLRLKRNDHVSRSSAAIFTAAKITMVLSGVYIKRVCVCVCIWVTRPHSSLVGRNVNNSQHKLTVKITSLSKQIFSKTARIVES